MGTFLELTATDLYNKYGDKLADIAVVFPNNRARLFFSEYLYKAAGKPVWTPGFTTISELFRQCSNLKIADNLELTGWLYKVFIEKSNNKDETFDEFYPWGEVLLSDFDDTDKNLADSKQLFRNIKDQAEFTDTLEHLSEEQVASIKLFFKNFRADRKTILKERFIENWNILSEVYDSFRELLLEKGIAYEGMLYRIVLEKLTSEGTETLNYQKYAFIGFNVLNQCETKLFSLIKKSGKALFYWDYDELYMNNTSHEASLFIRQNIFQFKNELDKSYFDNFKQISKSIHFISASSENAQARYITKWIKELREKEGEKFNPANTAIILCNESLLLSVLHSIPDEIQELNVTMGFPMIHTPIFNLLNQIAILHAEGVIKGKEKRFNHRYVLPVLQHPLVRKVSTQAEYVENKLRKANSFRPLANELQEDDLLKIIFSEANDAQSIANKLLDILKYMGTFKRDDIPDDFDPLYSEAVFRSFTLINRIHDLIKTSVIDVNLHTFHKLLNKALTTSSIPFSGEPVKGLQIMGMLETRNLDFKNILMLSVNEGKLPSSSNDISFIPYNLRKGFGLTTVEHKNSIFSYYFFRILQRAENISLMYNTSTEGTSRGEMSRFMLQLLVETDLDIKRYNLNSNIELPQPFDISINKTIEITDFIKNEINTFSPTALNSYLDCSLKFYLKYIAKLKKKDEVSEDIDGSVIGNIFHHSAQEIYEAMMKVNNEIIDSHQFEKWIKNKPEIERIVDYYFQKDYFLSETPDNKPEYNGQQLIIRNLVISFINSLLQTDKKNSPIKMIGLEKSVYKELSVETKDGPVNLKIGGIIDRIDFTNGKTRLIDYKTGKDKSSSFNIEELFFSDKTRLSHHFQIIFYTYILKKTTNHENIEPNIFYLTSVNKENNSTAVLVNNTDIEEFEKFLIITFQDLLDNEKPFQQTSVTDSCKWCDYKKICRR